MKERNPGLTISPQREKGGGQERPLIMQMAVLALFLAGFTLVMKDALPSAAAAWPVYYLPVLAAGIVLLFLYNASFGRLVLPAGLAAVLVFSLICRRQVTAGLGTIGGDLLQLYTGKTGRVTLDFVLAESRYLVWGLVVVLAVSVLLAACAVYKGSLLPALPLLIPVYAGLFFGFLPCSAGAGLLAAASVLLLMLRTGQVKKGALPQLGLAAASLCIALLIGLALNGRTDTGLRERLERASHERHFHTAENAMPEGDLSALGPLKKSDTPALEISLSHPEKLYLRGEIYEIYTGTAWKKQDTVREAEYEDLFYWLHEKGFYGQSQIGLASSLAGEAEPETLTVKTLNACRGHGYYPYALFGNGNLAADRLGDEQLPAEGTQSAGTGAEDAVLTLSYLPGSVPAWYQVQQTLASDQDRENVAGYLAAEQAYGDYVKEVDLQMTPESWEVVNRQLATEDTGRTLSEIRDIIRTYLEERVVYDESVRTLNGSGDFLQYVLEKSGSGYNVQYATAATLMLRYFGVPARYVEGYFLSAEQAAAYAAGRPIVLTEENAHAWAEYYLNGVGFVPFEVTPGYVDDEEFELGTDEEAEQTYEGNHLKFAPVQRPERTAEPEQDKVTFSFKAVYLLWILPVLAVILLFILIGKRRRFNAAMRKMDTADNREAVVLRYGYAAALLARSGIGQTGRSVNTAEEKSLEAAADTAGGMKEAYSDREAALLNREAMFSHHEITDSQRSWMEKYAGTVLEKCRSAWTPLQKLKYRLWECLF